MLADLPHELLVKMLSHASAATLIRVTMACQTLREAAMEEAWDRGGAQLTQLLSHRRVCETAVAELHKKGKHATLWQVSERSVILSTQPRHGSVGEVDLADEVKRSAGAICWPRNVLFEVRHTTHLAASQSDAPVYVGAAESHAWAAHH